MILPVIPLLSVWCPKCEVFNFGVCLSCLTEEEKKNKERNKERNDGRKNIR